MPRNLIAGIEQQQLDRDFPVASVATTATPRQNRLAVGIVVVLLSAAVLIAPFGHANVGQIDAFLPAVQSVLSAADVMTAILLLVQYSYQPQAAILTLGSGYLLSASFAFLQTLSFPGGYGPAGLIGDGTNTPAWFFVFWRFLFPLAVLIYAFSKDAREAVLSERSVKARIGLTVLCTLTLVAGTTMAVTTFAGSLPQFYRASLTLQTRLANQINIALLLWYAVVLSVLFPRRRTILDLWLIVTLVAWMPDSLVAISGSSTRFTIGWYAARCFALVASCILLCALLVEMSTLYSRLASAFSLLRRERANRLLSVDAATAAIAHEVRTPLAAISLNANAALGQLRARPPQLEELDVIIQEMEADSRRAGEAISAIRRLFKESGENLQKASVSDVARNVLKTMQHDLWANGVSVTTEFQDNLPQSQMDPAQMQQVVLNLVRNSIDAMASVAPRDRRLHLATSLRDSRVVLSVRDTGQGVGPADRKRIFDPFFTTKSSGTGLGLTISRTIVENQGGKLTFNEANGHGTVFEVSLPIAS
jgi:signal transduction histidine kinase